MVPNDVELNNVRVVVDICTKRYNVGVELNNDRAELILVPNDVIIKKWGGVDIGTKCWGVVELKRIIVGWS